MLKQALTHNGLIAILRGLRPDEAGAVGQVLYQAGFRVIEVPLNSPDPYTSIRTLRETLPADCLIGAGTVLTPEQVERVKAAGGQVIVMAPQRCPRCCVPQKLRACTCRPGSRRPTEAFAALAEGADVLKLFPAEQMGPAVVKAWLAVLPAGTVLLPVGGITPDNMQVFVDARGQGLWPGLRAVQARHDGRAGGEPCPGVCRCLECLELSVPGASGAASDKRDKKMKITKLTTFIVPPRWCFLKVETDQGVTGWGEPVVEGRAHTVAAAVEELSDYLIGKDPRNIEDIWTVLYRGGFYRGGAIHMSALAGIDQALWDIKGKALGVSVSDLLGGQVRDKIRVYSWIGGDRPADTARAAKEAVARGFTAVKMNGTEELQFLDTFDKVDQALANVAAVRDAVGPNVGIGVDFHGRVHKPMAKVLMKELDPYKLMFIEEPVLSENYEALKELAPLTSTPIALGERLFSRWDFKRVLSEGYVDIIQPDASHAGGITETRKIANMAEAYDVALALHCPLGPIALAACLQLDAVCYNAFIQEQSLGIHYNESNDLLDYVRDPGVFDYDQGFVKIPNGPGLGIEINEEYVIERAAIGHRWRNPIWRHADGSFAEW
jgi:galactonate dehydratase